MTTKTEATLVGASANFLAATNRFMPRVMFAPDDGTGSGDEGDKSKDETKDEAKADEKKVDDKSKTDETNAGKAGDDADKAALLREVMDKKNKLKETSTELEQARAALKAFEGIDPVKVRDLLQREIDAEKAKAEAKGDFERVKAMMVEEHGKEKQTLAQQLAELTKQLQAKDSIIDGLTVGNDFASSNFILKETTLSPAKARKLYGDHFEVKDGRTVAFDKPAGSKDRTELTGADGKPLKFDEAFKRIIDADPDKDSLLRATVNAGAGSKTVAEKAAEKAKPSGKFGIDRIRGNLADLVDG